MLAFEEHDLDKFVEGEVTKPEDEVTRAKVQKGTWKEQRR